MELITDREQRRKATAKLKLLKWKLRQSKRMVKRLEDEIYTLDSKVWNLEVALVKPEQMCRNRWSAGYYCALKRGHTGCCQGQAPKLEYK